MLRVVTSYILTSIVLLSQAGLPLHLHYCKGMLESVSVFFNQGCDDHKDVTNLPACCQKTQASHCSAGDDGCCNDQISILIQDFDSLIPHFAKWDVVAPQPQIPSFSLINQSEIVSCPCLAGISTDTGPPIYIRYQSLIFYAWPLSWFFRFPPGTCLCVSTTNFILFLKPKLLSIQYAQLTPHYSLFTKINHENVTSKYLQHSPCLLPGRWIFHLCICTS